MPLGLLQILGLRYNGTVMLASFEGSNHRSWQETQPGVQRGADLLMPLWLRLGLLALLLFAFGVRLQELTRQDIWWDEARNIDVALRPFLQIPIAPELDIQPPVYYWLLHGWDRLFGAAIGQPAPELALFSRLLSVFAGVCGVALLFALARRALPAQLGLTGGLLAALVGACSPFWLAESQEARMYTTGFALAAAAAVVLLHYVDRQDANRRLRDHLPRLAAFVLLSTAALLTHYNMVFVLVAWYAWWAAWALLRSDRWRQIGVIAGCGALMVLLVLPMAPIALRQIPGYENPNITIVSVAEYLRQNWQAYAGGYAFDGALLGGYATWWLWGVLLLAAVGLGAAAIVLWRRRRREPATGRVVVHFSFLLAWLIGALVLYYVAVLDRNAFNVRYASFVTPALYALLGIGLAALAYVWKPLPLLGALLLVGGLLPAQQADLYDSRHDREHIAEVAAWLKANTGPGDVIFVDQKYPFGFYWQPYTVGAEESSPPQEGEVPARYLFVDINTIDQRLDEWAGNARRVFWLRWFESDTDPRHAVPFLLDKYGKFGGEQLFQGYTLQWWDMQPPSKFVLAPDMAPAHYAFPPAVETVEVSLPQTPLHPGDPLGAAIRWQRTPNGTFDRPLKARVALYDANDGRLVQADERLLNDRHRAPSQWAPEDRPLNVYMLPLPPELAPGTYAVRLLVYDADTLEPLTLVDAAGNPAGQEAVLGTIEVETP